MDPKTQQLVDETAAWLATDEAAAMTKRDSYWPKWEVPWWRMVLLWEMGAADRIPRRAVDDLVAALDWQVLHTFPTGELPPGVDPARNIACHCQLGVLGQVLHACGVDVDAALPWVQPWLMQFQLPDGGLNCDEKVYTKEKPHSSIVSTLPAAELVLARWSDKPGGRAFVDKAAVYLMDRKLNRSRSRGGAEINSEYWTPCFPRFYEYDVLRGLEFLGRWSRTTGAVVPAEATAEAMQRVDSWFGSQLAPRDFTRAVTSWHSTAADQWERAPSRRFALLDQVIHPDIAIPLLRGRWEHARADLQSRP